MFNIIYYTTGDGKCPVTDFIESLPLKLQLKALRNIDVLTEKGWTLREPLSKPVGGGLFELRTIFSGDITRVFYFFMVGENIVLTNGFIKKTKKTPTAEIELALKYKEDYEARVRGEMI